MSINATSRHLLNIFKDGDFTTSLGSQDATGLLDHLGTLLAHVQLSVNQHPDILLCWVTFHPFFPKPIPLHGDVMTQPHGVPVSPFLSRNLSGSPTLQHTGIPPGLLSSGNLLRVHAISSFQLAIKTIKQYCPQYQPPRVSISNWLSVRLFIADHNTLRPIIQLVFQPLYSLLDEYVFHQFVYKNNTGDHDKSLAMKL